MKAKGIDGNMKGDGLVQGGIIVIGPSPACDIVYTYREETGIPIPIDEIDAAIAKVKQLAAAKHSY